MRNQTRKGAFLFALAIALLVAGSGAVSAQDSEPSRPQQQSRAEINHEIQLHLLVTAEGAEGAARVPQSLDAVVRQLKTALPPSEYRLAATFINRVRDGGAFEVKSAGAPSFGAGQTPNQLPPAFLQIAFQGVKLIDPAASQPFINIQQFRLGMRWPFGTVSVSADKSGGSPVVQYEETGVSTQLNVREGEPTLLGTLNTSRTGQLFAIVITVHRTK